MKRTIAALVFLGVLLAAAPAMAQTTTTNYGGGPGTTTLAPVVGATSAGTVTPGQTFTVEQGGFAPGSPVSTTVNGVSIGTQTADSGGFVRFTVKVLSCSQVSVNGRTVPAQPGTNTIVSTGTNASGAPVTQTTTFTITGCAAGVTRAATRSTLSFTGANVLRWSLVALALIGLGAIFVVADRRKRRVTN